MSRAAAKDDFEVSHALARTHQFAARTCALYDERALGSCADGGEPFVGARGADFFVRVEGAADGKPLQVLRTRRFAGVIGCQNAALAVRAARAMREVAVNGEGARGGSAVGKNRVEMTVQKDVVVVGMRLISCKKTPTRFGAEVYEFACEADGFEVALHDFRCASDAGRIARAAVQIHEWGEVFDVVV